jgi:D-sedoheptulose 7-phosphate isomerase
MVGKRALPALDLSIELQTWLRAILRPEDIAMGFGPPEGDAQVAEGLDAAQSKGAMTIALPGKSGSYALRPVTDHPFMHQELMEILYHTLWETVHVFFEHREIGHDAGNASFLYPFLQDAARPNDEVVGEVARSIESKARENCKLRAQMAHQDSDRIAAAAAAMEERLARGGKFVVFGNGGSATDANDWALDCIAPPPGHKTLPAISLAMEPANLTAIANDVGVELVFSRQVIAHACPEDIAVGISTSGGSRNIVLALEEARKRGCLTFGLLGGDGGEVLRRGLCDHNLLVPSSHIPRIQEVQASLYHVLLESLGAS